MAPVTIHLFIYYNTTGSQHANRNIWRRIPHINHYAVSGNAYRV